MSIPTIALRFLREARAAAAIRHPGLVDVLDAGQEEDGGLYLVLELLQGQDLEDALRAGDVSGRDTVEVCMQALEALEVVHEQGFVHRDVKPANIFLSEAPGDHRVRLLDFGIAKRLSRGESVTEITRRGSLLGTLQFMAPEQAAGNDVDRRCDIWGIGATIFYAFAARPPYDQEIPGDLLRAVMYERAPSLKAVAPETPDQIAAVVDKSLRREPDDRYRTAAELREALATALAAPTEQQVPTLDIDVADTTESKHPAPIAPPTPSGRPWPLAAAIALGVGAVLCGAVWLALRPKAEPIPVEVTPKVATAPDPIAPIPIAPPEPESEPEPEPEPEPDLRAPPKPKKPAKKKKTAKKTTTSKPSRTSPDDPMRAYQ